MSVLIWFDLAFVLVGAGIGAFLGGPVRSYFLRLLGTRRYRAHVAVLESKTDREPEPLPSRIHEITPDLPAEFGRTIGRRPPYFFLADLDVRNLRCFSETSIRLRFPEEREDLRYPNVNLLLGDNGSGKSTILRAIAMAALGPVLPSSGFVPYRLVTRGAEEAQVSGTFIFGGTERPIPLAADVSVTRRGDFEEISAQAPDGLWSDLFEESSPSFFIAGYGTNRHVSDDPRADPSQERGRRRRRYQRVASLLEDSASLVPLSAWLPQVGTHRQDEVSDMFKELLPQRAYFTGQFEGGEPVFMRRGVPVPLRAMSDGFRSYIGWLSDLLFQLSAVAPTGARLTDIGGIALVDEVDLLLHPSWQRVVVPTISDMLPRMQFVFTTHSPIVAATLEAENIVVAREGGEGRSVLERIDAEIHGLSAEQVLLSSYFGLETTRAPDVLPGLEELARRAVEGDKQAARDYLRALVEPESPTQRKLRP